MPQSRDPLVIGHVQRYHLTTNRFLHQACFADVTQNAVEKVTARLVHDRWLQAGDLPGGEQYFFLTSAAVRQLGENRRLAQPFSLQGLIQNFAILAFCVTRGVERITYREFVAAHPDLCRRGLSSSAYYLDRRGGQERLALLLVDQGASPWRLAVKVRKNFFRRDKLPAFNAKLHADEFLITLLTPSEGKRTQLESELLARAPADARLAIEVVPEYLPLFGLEK